MSHISYVEVWFALKKQICSVYNSIIFYLHTKEKQISHVEAFIDIETFQISQVEIYIYKKNRISYVEELFT